MLSDADRRAIAGLALTGPRRVRGSGRGGLSGDRPPPTDRAGARTRGPAQLAAVSSGVEDAIAQARTRLQKRHGVSGPLLWRPTVSGGDAPDVVEAVRVALAESGTVEDAVTGWVPTRGARGGETTREQRRPERVARQRGTYSVPFYEDGKPDEVPADGQAGPGIPTMAEVQSGLCARLAAGVEHPGRYGAVDRGGRYEAVLVWLDASSGTEVFWIGRFSSIRPPAEGSDQVVSVNGGPDGVRRA